MESNGTPPNGNEKITRSPERDLGFLGPVANSEFEDESPGSYLAELGVRRWNVVWSIGNLIVTAAAAICLRLNIESLALDVVWKLCPVSCVLLLLITLWQRASRYTQSAVGKSRLSLALTAIALVVWFTMAPTEAETSATRPGAPPSPIANRGMVVYTNSLCHLDDLSVHSRCFCLIAPASVRA